MKKLLFAILIASLLLTTSAYAAEKTYDSVGDLVESWGEDGIPEYVCGIYSTFGGTRCLTIAVKDNAEGEAGKEEILSLIEDDTTVTFIYQKHSRNYLTSIMEDLNEYFEKDIGLVYAGTNEYENRVDIGIYEEFAKNNESTKEMMAELTEKYGDAIYIEYSKSRYVTTYTNSPFFENELSYHGNSYLSFAIFAAIVLVFGSAILLSVRRKRILVTNTGETLTAHPVTKAETKELIKNSAPDFPDSLDRKIYDSISK